MKKFLLKTVIFASISIFLASCGSTAVAPSSETAGETVAQTQETVANQIADEMNKVAPETNLETSQDEKSDDSDDSNNLVEENRQTESQGSISAEPEVTAESEIGNPNGITFVSTAPSSAKATIINSNPGENAENDENKANDAEQNSESDDTQSTEKVSDEDSNLEKTSGNAPTTDEKSRVTEYAIFDEPEVVVHDLPETASEKTESEEQKVEAVEETPVAQENPSETEENTVSENSEPKNEITENREENANSEPTSEITESETESENPAAAASAPEETNQEANPKEEASKTEFTPSRSVTVKKNQYLDITYPGTGWVYIGETQKDALFNYFGRKLGTGNTTFSLRAKNAGETMLHFYKNDALTGEYIDDYLSVKVEDSTGTGRVKAPSYAEIVPAAPQRRIERENSILENEAKKQSQKAEEKSPTEKTDTKSAETKKSESPKNDSPKVPPLAENKKSESEKQTLSQPAQNIAASPKTESDIKTVIQTTDSENSKTEAANQGEKENPKKETAVQSFEYTPISSESKQNTENVPIQEEPKVKSRVTEKPSFDESLLDEAKKDFEDKKYADALKKAEEYYNSANTRLDEALFLLGQISESNSSVKDIRFAVDSYDLLVKRFPQSKYWKQAKQRSVYLKRFYIDIR